MKCIRCDCDMNEVEVISRLPGNKVGRLYVISKRTNDKVRIITPFDKFPVVESRKCPICGMLEFYSD